MNYLESTEKKKDKWQNNFSIRQKAQQKTQEILKRELKIKAEIKKIGKEEFKTKE